MMRIFRKGERYVLSKPIYKSRYLSGFRKSGVVTLLICLFSFHFVCFAQESRESGMTGIGEIKPLQIGDTIPEELWNMSLQVVNHPDGKDTITLNDYRDKKLIILDFWSTYCGTCYYTFPETFNTVEPHIHDISLIPMTYQVGDVVVKSVEKNKYLQSINGFYTVVNSHWFRPLFGVKWFPQLIVLDNEGKVLAHLRPRHLDEESLVNLLKGASVQFPEISYHKAYPVSISNYIGDRFQERRELCCVV